MHHEDPQALIGLPFFFPATVAFALWFLFRRLLGEGEASLMMAAVATNFLYYGLLHHGHHHGRLKAGYFQRMRSYHHIHHHFPDRNFGLTMTLWDWVFGTHYLSGKRSRTHTKRLPRGSARELLCDAQARAAQSSSIPNPGQGEDGRLRLHRGLVQHPPSPLRLDYLSPTDYERRQIAAGEPKPFTAHESGRIPGRDKGCCRVCWSWRPCQNCNACSSILSCNLIICSAG